MIKALILDLDDTIFPTSSIDSNLVKPFFDKLEEVNDVLTEEGLKKAKQELWRKPFNVVAEEFGFSERMISKSLVTLNSLEFELSIQPFDDYKYLQAIVIDKYLVTTGIKKLQMSKIESLGLSNDFREIFIDDPFVEVGGKLKKFKSILENQKYLPKEVLVIGDNAESEIKAGQELGMHTLIINRNQIRTDLNDREICSFSEIYDIIKDLEYKPQHRIP